MCATIQILHKILYYTIHANKERAIMSSFIQKRDLKAALKTVMQFHINC